MNKVVALAFIFISSLSLEAQISIKGKLDSLLVLNKNLAAGRLGTKLFVLEAIDNDVELQRANKLSNDCANCKREFYGKGIDIFIDVKKQGERIELDQGFLWTLAVESKNAYALQFYFHSFKLPEGSELYLTNSTGTMTLGSFGSHNNSEDEKLATQTIIGDKVILKYFEPKNASFSGKLTVNKVIHAFKNVYKSGFNAAQDCNIDINCSEGLSYQDLKRSVARISYYDNYSNLAAWCTGTLINTTSNSKKPYLLTASHCVTAPSGLENTAKYRYWQWVFEFNYELEICNGSVEPLTNSVSGATLLSKGNLSDYALLNLQAIPDYFNVLYLGWDVSETLPVRTLAIHHPRGDVKKISIDTESPTLVKTQANILNSSWFDETAGLPKTDLKVVWNTGITEGGSSGSALINQDKKIVGQLRGGSSTCEEPIKPDYFGRLSVSMNNPDIEFGAFPLKYFLDDNNTGATNWASYDPLQANTESFKINSIEVTSNNWADAPKLFGRISYNGNPQDLHYSWSPASDFFNPNEAVGILYFNGQKPYLPFTKKYTLIVTAPNGQVRTQQVTVSIYDCGSEEQYIDLCVHSPSEIGVTGRSNETYSWSPSNYLSSADVSNPVFSPPGVGLYEYELEINSTKCNRNVKYVLNVSDYPTLPEFRPSKVDEAAFSNNYPWPRVLVAKTDGNGFVLTTETDDCRLKKLDSELNIVWEINLRIKGLGNADIATPVAILSNSNGSTVVLGKSTNFGFSLVKVDKNGNVVSSRVYSPYDPTSNFYQEYVPAYLLQGVTGDVVVIGRASLNSKAWMFMFKSKTGVVSIHDQALFSGPPVIDDNDNLLLFGLDHVTKFPSTGPIERIPKDASPLKKIIKGHDGGFVGYGDHVSDLQKYDIMFIKFDKHFKLVSQRIYGSSGYDYGRDIITTDDGGYLLAGESNSPAGRDKSQPSRGSYDFWVLKVNNNGDLLGEASYGSNDSEHFNQIIDAGLANCLLTGISYGSVSGDRTIPNNGYDKNWLVKITDSTSPITNTSPQKLEVCQTFESTFNNRLNPFRNELVIIGGCSTQTVMNSGSFVYARASEKLVIGNNTHIKPGSYFQGKISPLNISICEIAGDIGGSSDESEEESIKVEDENSDIKIYPNPSNGLVNILGKFEIECKMSLVISNVTGKVLLEKEYEISNNLEDLVDLSSYSNGVYIIMVKIGNLVERKTIILAK